MEVGTNLRKPLREATRCLWREASRGGPGKSQSSCDGAVAKAMPLLALTVAQMERALEQADSDLKYLPSEVGVDEEVQAVLFHQGFTTLRLFSGIDETRTEVRAAIMAETGLDHNAGNAERRAMALLLSAWDTARTQQRSNDATRAEARAAMVPRPVPVGEHAMLREALEAQVGRLKDSEIPSKNLIAAKMEDIETNMPRHEDLRDVASIEDGEADLLQGNLDPSSGTFKLKAARNTVSMPKTAEELRLRHRRIGVAWEMARTRHRNRVWLQGGIVEAFRQVSDHILGKYVSGLALPNDQKPKWEIVLSYEQEIRKKAYQWVRQGDSPTIEEALLKAIRDPELMNLHFVIPVTTSVAASASSSSAPKQRTTSPTAKGNSKGKKPDNTKATKKLHVKTPDGRPLCFKYNNNNKCTAKNCTFVHQCQKCLGSHPKSSCPRKGDTARAAPPDGGAN